MQDGIDQELESQVSRVSTSCVSAEDICQIRRYVSCILSQVQFSRHYPEVQETINLVVEGQEAAVKTQLAIQQSMEEIARQTKPKSRDDVAKEHFEKNKKRLNPLPDSGANYDAYRKIKAHGTCEWISKNPKYEYWLHSTKSSTLSVSRERSKLQGG